MKERIQNIFKWVGNINNLIKVISTVILVGGFATGMVAKHNASVIMTYVDGHKAVNTHEVDSIVRLSVSPLATQVTKIARRDSIRSERIIKKLDVVNDAMNTHLKNSKLYEERTQFLENELNAEKKNNSSYSIR
jgi:hypothetical protein